MPDPVREALEWMADAERVEKADTPEALHEWAVEAHDRARAALAASSPPAREEWRVIERSPLGEFCIGPERDDESAARRTQAFMVEGSPNRTYIVQRCGVGPWVDVPTEGEGAGRTERMTRFVCDACTASHSSVFCPSCDSLIFAPPPVDEQAIERVPRAADAALRNEQEDPRA